jgi:hypothetical protein
MSFTAPEPDASCDARPPALANPPRRRGRPPLATREEVLGQIVRANREGRLFRVHFDQPALYARARRLWGSWAGALLAAGIDHAAIVDAARRRALETRRQRRQAAVS